MPGPAQTARRSVIGGSLFAAGLTLLLGVAHAEAKPRYHLLELDGNYVKWGKAALGTGAVVTYRLADVRMSFEGATNCREIGPLAVALGRSRIGPEEAMAEIEQAFAAWESVADLTFRPAGPTERADIVIGAQVSPRGRAYTNVAYVRAEGEIEARAVRALPAPRGAVGRRGNADARPSAVKAIAQSLICLNPGEPWKIGFGKDPRAYDLRYTLIHEIGHAIGLDHAGPEGEVMSFQYGEAFRLPQEGDIAGAQRLYGPPR
jgi:hypothetical protein